MIRSCSFLLLALLTSTHALAEKEYALSESETDVRGESQDLQLTPQAVTVIDGEEVETTYRRDLQDLQGLAPGLIVDSLSGTPQGAAISLRGVGTDDVNNGFLHPGVAVKVDGVYVGTHSSQMQVLFDFEQIDVVRGPNGTLEGAPNIDGTVNLKRRKPTGEFDIDVRASFGNYRRREYDVAVNVPITESIAGKITYSKKEDGGKYMNNVTVDRSENKEDRIATSVALQAKFGGVTANYIYDDEQDDADTPALLNLSTASDQLCIQSGASEDTCAFATDVPQTTSKILTAQNFSNERDYDGEYHTLTLDFDFASHEVTSITGVRETSEMSNHDLDASHVDFYSATRDQEYEQFSQEVTFRKQYNDDISYSFGFYFLDYSYKLFQEEFYILHALDRAGLACCFAQDEVLQTHSAQNGELQSAFIHGVYVLTQQWTVDAGVRFSVFSKDFSHQPRGWRQPNRVIPSKRSFVGKQTWEEAIPTLGVSYRVDNEAMIYLRYSTGNLPGGYDENALSIDTAQPTDPQTHRPPTVGKSV